VTANLSTLQATSQAPPPPPIPRLPAAPGAATGGGSGTEPAIAGDVGQAARDAAQAARDAAQVQRDIAQGIRDGLAGTTTGTQPPVDPEAILREVKPIVGLSLAMVVAIFIGWPLARAFARRIDRRTEVGTVRAADLQPQIRQLQESIDTMAVELERISEAQRFQAKLMSERAHALPSEQKRA
jgi:hypothetical protein